MAFKSEQMEGEGVIPQILLAPASRLTLPASRTRKGAQAGLGQKVQSLCSLVTTSDYLGFIQSTEGWETYSPWAESGLYVTRNLISSSPFLTIETYDRRTIHIRELSSLFVSK